MEKSQLAQLIQTFSSKEKTEIKKFLQSPFFNVRTDVVQLFELLSKEQVAEKSNAKLHLFGSDAPPDQSLRLTMTYLMRLLEQYIAQKEYENDENNQQLLIAVGLRKRGLPLAFDRQKKRIEKTMESQLLRDAKYHEAQFRLHWETHQLASSANPRDTTHLQAASIASDIAYLAQKLRLICLSAAQQTVYKADYSAVWEAEVVDFATQNFADQERVIAIYLHCYRMLRFPETVAHFQDFKNMLLDSLAFFSPDENRSFFIWAINYCVRQLNLGEKGYFKEVSDLYKAGIESGILLENGVISPYTYYNIVAAGLQTNDLDWVNFFIHEYKNNLEKQHRESAFSFSLARLEYAQEHFEAVLDLLQKANYRDPLLNLAAKTLLLKTWYELDETEILQSHLDAMRNYIHRKRVLGYHRTNYLNIIKYMDKILNLNWKNKAEVEKLRIAVVEEENLTEREWILGKLLLGDKR
jgi:hypothetical protein